MTIHCLICSDNDENRKLIKKVISRYCSTDILLSEESIEKLLDRSIPYSPHIIVLDFKAGFEGTLKQAAEIQKRYPESYFAIFIHFREFSFSEQLIPFENTEFLPRPIKVDNLQESITRIITQIHDRKNNILSSKNLESVINDNIPVIRQHYISLLMRSGRQNAELIHQKFKTLQINCPGPNYIVVIADLPGEKDKQNYEAISFLVLSSLKLQFKTEGYDIYLFFDSDYRINCMIGHQKKLSRLYIYEMMEHFREYCLLYMDVELCFGIGNTVDSVSRLHCSFSEAERELQKVYLNKIKRMHQKIADAKQHIDEHLGNPRLCLEQVSMHVGMSKSYFSRAFQKIQGVNFTAYLQESRINESKKLLADSELEIKEIAEKVGFSSAKYFSTVFREREGITPTQYRMLHKGNSKTLS